MARGRREGQRNLMRMLGSATSARRRSIDRTRRESARRLKKEQREAEARAEARYRKQHRYDWLGRGVKYGLTGLGMAMTGGVTGIPKLAGIAGLSGLGGMFLPEGAEPYAQQGAMAMQSMMGQRQQMALVDQQIQAQQQHTAAIMERLGGGARPSPYPAAAPQQPSAWDLMGQEAQGYRGAQDPFAQQSY